MVKKIADMKAIGVGVPDPVAMVGGGVISPPIIPGWDHFTIQDHLEKLWNIPITLNNDAELGALGEWAYNAGRSEYYLINVKVGYGIGAGLLIMGRFIEGLPAVQGKLGISRSMKMGLFAPVVIVDAWIPWQAAGRSSTRSVKPFS